MDWTIWILAGAALLFIGALALLALLALFYFSGQALVDLWHRFEGRQNE